MVARELGDRMANCIERKLLNIKFPVSTHGKPTKIGQPYNFHKK